MAICSKSYGNFALATYEKNITRKSDHGLIKLDSVWMTEYEPDQSSSQMRLTELPQKKDDRMAALANGLPTRIDLREGTAMPGVLGNVAWAFAIFDPGGLASSTQFSYELAAIERFNHLDLAMHFLSLCNDTKKSNSSKIF